MNTATIRLFDPDSPAHRLGRGLGGGRAVGVRLHLGSLD